MGQPPADPRAFRAFVQAVHRAVVHLRNTPLWLATAIGVEISRSPRTAVIAKWSARSGSNWAVRRMSDVGDWLATLGLAQYAPLFADNSVDMAVLPHLTDHDLKEIGIRAVGHADGCRSRYAIWPHRARRHLAMLAASPA